MVDHNSAETLRDEPFDAERAEARRLGAPWVAKLVRTAQDRALELLYPPRCLACVAPVAEPGALCADCWRETAFLSPPVCDHCGAPFDSGGLAFDAEDALCEACAERPRRWARGRAATLYDGAARDLVIALKHRDRTDAAGPMGRWMARAAGPLREEADIVAPIPLHWRRRLRRRFNQSALLARSVAQEMDLPLDLGALWRRRATPSQDGKSRAQRAANVAGAFAVTPSGRARLAGRRVLLVDDVLTTGATAAACAEALADAGVAKTHVLVFARVVSESHDPI